MEGGEGESISPHLESFAQKHLDDIKYLADELKQNKGIYLEGPPHKGKTSLAVLALNEILHSTQDGPKPNIFYTTPSQQEIPLALPVKDRTGITYRKLPPLNQIELHEGDTYILVDEISKKSPDPARISNWKAYVEIPNTHFIFLGHPGSATSARWLELFPKEKIKYIPFEEEQMAA